LQQPARIMPREIAGDSMAGRSPDARTDLLNSDHQGIGEEHGPADAIAELRAGLAVGPDARRIVIGRSGDQTWTKPFAEALQRLTNFPNIKRVFQSGHRRHQISDR
jgi:hypothetical protein